VTVNTRACILPPDLIVRVARDASPERRLALLQSLELDHSFRQVRAEAAARQLTRPLAGITPPGGTPSRMIYDQQHSTAADPGKLAKVLKYHIVPGYYTADDLLDRLFLKTLEGQRLRVWSDVSEVPLGEKEIDTGSDALTYIAKDTLTTSVRESIKINGGHVLQANVIADNGIMHVIDKVLVPQFTML